jgi:hypothetical protein
MPVSGPKQAADGTFKIVCHPDVTGTERHQVTSGGLERIF